LQQFVVAAKPRQAGLDAQRTGMRKHGRRQFFEAGAHGCAPVGRGHLQRRQACDHAVGQDGAAGGRERPARLGAACVDPQAKPAHVVTIR
jgi:hypothetical protein